MLQKTFLVTVLMAMGLLAPPAFAQEITGYNPDNAVSLATAKVRPSIVAIETRFDEPMLKDKYAYWQGNRGARPLYGLWGTGFIFEDPQYVLTASKLLDDAEFIRVILDDGRSYKAELVGKNSDFKLAVLKVDWGPDIEPQPAQIADSDLLKLGQPIGVVGKALNSVDTFASYGIISALRKHIPDSEEEMDEMIQFDASYHISFIGGTIIDVYGNVVGMISGTEGGVNINLAVPINEVVSSANSIIGETDVDINFGVETQFMTMRLIEQKHAPSTVDMGDGEVKLDFGMWVSFVMPNSPADIAGLRPRDTILQIDGEIIKSKYTWKSIFREFQVGQLVSVMFVRENELTGEWQILVTEVQVEEAPEDEDEDEGGGSVPSNPHG